MEHLWCERDVKKRNRDVKILTLPEEAMKTSWQKVPLPRSPHVPHIPHIYRPPSYRRSTKTSTGRRS